MGIKNPKGLSIYELDNTGHKMAGLYLINIFAGSQSWNIQHHGQTITSKRKVDINEFVQNSLFSDMGMIIFDLHGYGGY